MEIRKRKLISTGKSSLAIVIPKPWLDYYNLHKGDQLEMITNGDVRLIPPTKKGEIGGK